MGNSLAPLGSVHNCGLYNLDEVNVWKGHSLIFSFFLSPSLG